ncbi:DUF4168 domain-containing protein [Calothrix sp. PCC 7507]|uniref:DUF4168 domain-containing protein n=1 Tax=Calothrix sp. PCC 7507 TaxID=99598 RepID=UPI00029ED3BA|nr:DUF4168 domain-containing protein [Calothrix sp. PCC 7507]AFY34559.1 hypothetical protein Cal7507_4180 [Calothrix sp. PCC 7507]
MKRISDFFLRLSLQRKLSQSFFYGAIASVSVVTSVLVISTKTNAQTPAVNNTEVNSYAQAVLAMEPARQKAFEEIKKLIGGREIPKIVCNDSNSINGLSSQAKDIAVNYCNRSQKIVEDNGLSIDRFNKITVELQNNNDLKQQVLNRLIHLQKVSDPR